MDNDAMWDPRPRIGPPDDASAGDRPDVPESLVLVELAGSAAGSESGALDLGRALASEGFDLDEEYGVVPMGSGESYIIQGELRDEQAWDRVAARPEVVKIWRSTPIAPF